MFAYGGTLIPESSDVAGLGDIAAADPMFRDADFIVFATTVFLEVHRAVASGNPGAIGGMVTQELSDALGHRSGGHAKVGVVERVDHVAVIAAEHGRTDAVTVRFGAAIDGRQIVEDWVFERPANAFPHLDGVIPASCPSCRAPLNVDGDGNCRQCATHIVGVAGPWRAADVLPPRTLDTAEPQTTDVAFEPGFATDDFLTFARSVHTNVRNAVRAQSIDTVGDVLADDLRRHLVMMTPDDDVVGWDLSIDHINDAAIVAARRGFLDTITVRFDVSSDDDRFIADWTFERPAPLPASPVRSATRCPVCGAAVDLDEEGHCRYCSTHLLGVAGDWRLVRVQPPTMPMMSHPVFIKGMQTRGGQIALIIFIFAVVIGVIATFVVIILSALLS